MKPKELGETLDDMHTQVKQTLLAEFECKHTCILYVYVHIHTESRCCVTLQRINIFDTHKRYKS